MRLRKHILLWCWCGFIARVFGEWVELPQFSDRDKVYGSPIAFFHKQNQLSHQKSNRRLYHQQPTYFDQDDSYYHPSVESDRHESSSFHRPYMESSWRNVSKYPVSQYQGSYEEDTEPSISGTIASFTTERVISSIIDDHGGLHEQTILESSDEKYPVSTDESSTTENSSEDKTMISKPAQTTTTVLPSSSTESKPSNETDDKRFLDYLPVDLLKKVHKTLKSQPATLKGKIRFLKAFESTLVDEIENRLSVALAPSRVPRGARDHYEHYEHDDSLGFPSLEGTLMAISFLTFAVYLVRLVMLLFRNTNNNIPPIFGRKKRSVDEFNEEAARILGYLETSFPRHYMK